MFLRAFKWVLPMKPNPNTAIFISVILTSGWGAAAAARAAVEDSFTEVEVRSSFDGAVQKALWWAPAGSQPAPLLVALHSWSADYRQAESREYLKRCRARGWALWKALISITDGPDASAEPLRVIAEVLADPVA